MTERVSNLDSANVAQHLIIPTSVLLLINCKCRLTSVTEYPLRCNFLVLGETVHYFYFQLILIIKHDDVKTYKLRYEKFSFPNFRYKDSKLDAR